ncbi:MAG: GIY-YIG nuclease family protein [Rhodomicrobium sp.]
MTISKKQILEEVKKAAAANDGCPLGRLKFQSETGVSESDWRRYWLRWSDAVREAGYEPNEWTRAYDEAALLERLCAFIRELGHFPISGEFRMKARNSDFPSEKAFRRLGTKAQMAARLFQYCKATGGLDDVADVCSKIVESKELDAPANGRLEVKQDGYVYLGLLKVGREKRYKIGATVLVERRTDQLSIQLPEKLELVHAIRTDDPYGIEAYWHKRFKDKNTKGEWFTLSIDDVRAFKKRRFM